MNPFMVYGKMLKGAFGSTFGIDRNASEGDSFAALRAGRVDCVPHFGVEHRGGRAVRGWGDGSDSDYGIFSAAANVHFDSSYGGRGHRSRRVLGIADGDTTELFSSKRTHYIVDAELRGSACAKLCGFRAVERSKRVQLPGISDVHSGAVITDFWYYATSFRDLFLLSFAVLIYAFCPVYALGL